jgi:hypothetical protein
MRCCALNVMLTLVGALASTACGQSNPTSPSTTTALTASVAAPRPLTPANNAVVANGARPATLIVQNAIVTKPGGTIYTFEVATDSAFASKVQTKDGVAEGSGGQTGVKIDALPPGRDYFWHARATAAGTTGLFGAVSKFTVGPPVTLNPPTPIGPLSGAATPARPAFRVSNATRLAATGPVSYLFEISTSPAFASTIAASTVAEGSAQTEFDPAVDLPSTGTLYWRATAIDATDGVTSVPSAVQSFSATGASQAALVAARLGVALWPGVQPPGAEGHAIMGSDWTVEPLVSFDGHPFMNPPIDELQIFDLLDRGFSPSDAVDWMHANGYATIGVWYPSVSVIAFAYEYIALINGQWDIVIRVGA